MADLPPESIKEFKETFKEHYNYEFKSDEEAREAAENLVKFFDLLIEVDRRESKKLKSGRT